ARWKLINTALDLPFPDPPETYSSSPDFFEAMGIPAGTTGRLPRDQRTRSGLESEVLEDIGGTSGRRAPKGGGGSRDKSGPRRDSAPRDDDAAPARPPRSGEPRRRTRRSSSTGEVAGGTPASAPEVAPAADTVDAAAKRRRRRGGRGRGQGSGAAPDAASAANG
ncbi:MAG: hypothetical protein ABIM89_17735, partial [Mycobacteriales bacterium]